ncbi:MAG: MarR family transcriptional regulator [Burkholderiaceae bacterium]
MSVEKVDTRFLETLLGYNARRASLTIIELFVQRMAAYPLRPVDFSVLSLVAHNPGITSRQLCTALGIQPPNLVALVGALEKRQLLRRERHRADGRAVSLYLTPEGQTMLQAAEQTAIQLEQDAAPRLSAGERKTLMRLLQKVYLPE